jgi:hypothetical protein
LDDTEYLEITLAMDIACRACGATKFACFVQHGSYFSCCQACNQMGWATSWMAVSNSFTQTVRAVVVDEQHKEIEVVGQGSGPDLMAKIAQAAGLGKLVMLATPQEE